VTFGVPTGGGSSIPTFGAPGIQPYLGSTQPSATPAPLSLDLPNLRLPLPLDQRQVLVAVLVARGCMSGQPLSTISKGSGKSINMGSAPAPTSSGSSGQSLSTISKGFGKSMNMGSAPAPTSLDLLVDSLSVAARSKVGTTVQA
jgi:hypothetical protein